MGINLFFVRTVSPLFLYVSHSGLNGILNIKKGTKIKTNQLGVLVSGIMEDNTKGNTRLITTKGSEVGLFDEMGSVYAWNIILAKNNKDEWEEVKLTDKQIKAKQLNESINESMGF